MKIGLIGCGAIGQFLLEKINQEKVIEDAEIIAVFDERESSHEKLRDLSMHYSFDIYQDIEQFLQTPIDIVIECANVGLVNDYAETILEQKDMLIISIGALVDGDFFRQLEEIAKQNQTKVYLPTGAIGGLDLIKSANSLQGLKEVTLISRKPTDALVDANFEGERLLFEGTAREAIEQFPKNANVSIAISLAGVGVDQTVVQIIADPKASRNTHTIKLAGEFGRAEITIENKPSPNNPKTSALTSLSILATIQSLEEQIFIG